jgi:hypothetical protein
MIGKISVVTMLLFAVTLFSTSAIAVVDECQGPGCSANAEANAGAAIDTVNDINIQFPEQKDITTTRVDAKGYRGFPEAGNVPIPGTLGYFGTPTPGSSFQSIKVGLMYKDVFTVDELKKMSKDNTINGSLGSKVIVTPLVDKVADKDKAEFIKVLLKKPGETLEVTLLGYITVKATSKGTVSMEILAEAALAARDLGADVIHVTAEGVDRELRAFSWGIGLSYSRASISDSESSGGIASGGTGISGGSAGYTDLPWFQIFVLKVK